MKIDVYKRQQGIRNQMHAKISFGVLDQYAFGDAAFTVSPGVSFSDPSGIQTGVNNITESYASWEQNFWQLTGKQRFLNDANPDVYKRQPERYMFWNFPVKAYGLRNSGDLKSQNYLIFPRPIFLICFSMLSAKTIKT